MSFDACYIVFAGRRPPISELIQYWQQQDYQLQHPGTKKVHLVTQDGDAVLVDELPQQFEDQDLNFSLWLSTEDDLFVTLTKRGSFFTEEYGFMGISGEEYMGLIRKLNQRYMGLTEQGLLMGVLFDRREYVIESILDW